MPNNSSGLFPFGEMIFERLKAGCRRRPDTFSFSYYLKDIPFFLNNTEPFTTFSPSRRPGGLFFSLARPHFSKNLYC
jgi:hypothetical protein